MSRSSDSTEILQLAIERVLRNKIKRFTDWDDITQSCYHAVGGSAPAEDGKTLSESTLLKIENALVKIYLTEHETLSPQKNRLLSQIIHAVIHEYKSLKKVSEATMYGTMKHDKVAEVDDIALRATVIRTLPYAITYKPLQHECETLILAELSRKITELDEELLHLLSDPTPDLLSIDDLDFVTKTKQELHDTKEKINEITARHSSDPENVLSEHDKKTLQRISLKRLAILDKELPEIRRLVFHAISQFRFVLHDTLNRLDALSLHTLDSKTKALFEAQQDTLKKQLHELITANPKEINLEDKPVTRGAMTLFDAITVFTEKVEAEKQRVTEYNTQGFFKQAHERTTHDSHDKTETAHPMKHTGKNRSLQRK